MNRNAVSLTSLGDLWSLVVRYPVRWMAPAVVTAIAVVAFVALRNDTWEATQALVARNDTNGAQDGAGKFRHSDELKAVLETVLELSKSRGVLSKALVEVGPPADATDVSSWPSEQDISDLADAVKVAAPKGAEFGKTEVFYLKVKSSDRARALLLVDALCREIESQYGLVRNHRAASMIDELVEAERLARRDVEAATNHLTSMEEKVGGDLAELRNLHQPSGAGESDLRRKAVEMESELRQARVNSASRSELLRALRDAESDPNRLLALPNGLLESQPSLRKMKDGLIDAQVRTSTLLGTMSPAHPAVRAARIAESEITTRLQDELTAAIRGVEMDNRLATERVTNLSTSLANIHERLQHLAGMRADYTRLISEADQRSRLLADVERKLVDARASQAGANKASLITRLDAPDTGSKPIGPSKSMLMLAGMAGGLVLGFAVLLLTASPEQPSPIRRAAIRSAADLQVPSDLDLIEAA